MSTSLAIVERRPSFAGGGGCGGGVLFHLLDWHRRLARKRRLFSPRRLLPSSLRSNSPRRLPAPPASTATSPPAAHLPTAADGATAPGVVARLMGLESWPAGAGPGAPPPAASRPQKQRKVDAAASARWQGDESAVVIVLPPGRRPSPAPTSPVPRNHHGADLPARSPRRSRLVHAAAAKLLDPGARGSSRASARLAPAYASSSPQHRKDGHSGALQSSSMADDFLSRSGSLSLERSTRVQSAAVQPPVLPADTEWDSAIASRRYEKRHSVNTMSSSSADVGVVSDDARVIQRTDFDGSYGSRGSSGVDAMPKEHRARTDGMSNCPRMRSNGAGARIGKERLLRKRGTPSAPDVAGRVWSGSLGSFNHPSGSASELVSGSKRTSHSGSGQRRELIGSITPQRSTRKEFIGSSTPQRSTRKELMGLSTPQRSTRRDPIDQRSELASTSRTTSSNTSRQKRGSHTRKVGRDVVATNREDSKTVAFASSSSVRPVTRASSHDKVSEKRECNTQVSNTACTRIAVAESSPSFVGTSEQQEFGRLLKAKINVLGLSDRIESSDALSGKLSASVLQELISALTNDLNTSDSQHSNYSDATAPLSNDRTVHNSNDQSPDFQKCYKDDQEVDSSAACTNNEPNQPSPTSVLEAFFSNDTSSLGSPVEKIEGKDFFVSIENKMEDLFNLESDIVDISLSDDTVKNGAEEIFHDSGKVPSAHNIAAHDFKLLEARLHSIGEAISNAELLLGSNLLCSTKSSLSLHSFIIEMLEGIVDVFGGSDCLGHTEEKYRHTNFLFDCIIESMNSKFCNFGKCGYKAWLRLPLSLNKDLLKREISEEICSWSETTETASNRVTGKGLDQVTSRWDACQVEAFDVSIAIENDILEALVDEFVFDQL